MNNALDDGRKTSTLAAAPVAIAAPGAFNVFPIASVAVQAFASNTQQVAVGSVNCAATAGSQRGTILQPGQSETVDINDPSKLFLDVLVDGEGVTFTVLYR